MGHFSVTVEVANPDAPVFTPVEAIVDTGATYSMFPASLLVGLGVTPSEEQRFRFADGTVQAYGIGEARFRIDERERTTPVVFGSDGVYVLGAVSLESFGLIADTTHRKLIPSPELLQLGMKAVTPPRS